MISHFERVLRILEMLPENKEGITVHEIQKTLETYRIYVHIRTIQRDLKMLSILFYSDIDCFEDSNGKAQRWFRKARPEGAKIYPYIRD